MHYRYLLALSLSVAALPALAHDPLPALDWCSQGRAVPIGEFDFDGATLKSFRQCAAHRGGGTAPAICALLPTSTPTDDVICSPAMCGEFDDDYHVAKIAAFNYCNSLSNYATQISGGAGNTDHVIVPLFSSDSATLQSADHHRLYRLDEGAKGTCMLCLRADRNNPTQ